MSYVVVKEFHDSMVCLGVYENYNAALGEAMNDIFIQHKQYQLEGDEFEWNDPVELNDNQGIYITVKCKPSYLSKAMMMNYYILNPLYDERKPV